MILNSNLTSQNGLSLPNTLLRLLSVEHGEEQTQTKIYEELGWEILYYRRWYRRLCHFHKLQSGQRSLYLYNEIPHECTFSYKLWGPNVFESSAKRTDRFTHTYFQNCVREWNQLDQSIRNCPTISGFQFQLVRLVRPTKKMYFGCSWYWGSKTVNPFESPI